MRPLCNTNHLPSKHAVSGLQALLTEHRAAVAVAPWLQADDCAPSREVSEAQLALSNKQSRSVFGGSGWLGHQGG